MSEDIIIDVKNLKKNFKLPHEQRTSLKQTFLSFKPMSYETFHALNGITFDVKRGEFFGVVGRNGSGKSTLLKILACIYQPSAGAVRVEGNLTPFIELGIGFNPELSGRDNVYLNGAILGLSHKEVAQKYDAIVEFAELEKFMDQKIKNYSSGMQVRLAFALAIQSYNEVLLIDEVLAVGDEAFQKKCFDFFNQLKAEKKTVVFISHDMSAVREYCDRAILIENGKITAEGSPAHVAEKYSALM